VAGLAERQLAAPTGHLIVEGDEAAVRIQNGCQNCHFIVETRGVQIAAVGFRHRQQNSIRLHIFVPESDRRTVLDTSHFHPDQKVRVIRHAHLVGLGIADPNGGEVGRHGLRLYRALFRLSVKLPVALARMRIQVLFFGLLKDICGRPADTIELPEGASASAVFEYYAARFPRLREMASSIVLARNHEFATALEPLADGDEVALLPPVSGGAFLSEVQDPAGHFFALTRDPIDPRAIETRLLQGCDGAIVTFQGVVRNNTSGRRTLRLEYEGYEPMALRKMAEIGRDVASRYGISRIAMVHRLGTLEIGEASVMVVAVSPHRRAAFDAALAGIDNLKKLVPVWKKEFFEDGEIWVEGAWDEHAPRISPA